MNIFITGATGFIGSALANHLSAAGHKVRALVRLGSDVSCLDPAVEFLIGSLGDDAFEAECLAQADVVCHLAGETKAFSARGFSLVNEDLTKRLVLATRKYSPSHQIFIHVSSQAAIGPCATAPGLAEHDRPAPVSQYGLSKLLGERAVLEMVPERRVAVIRPPMVYGPGDQAFVPLYRLMDFGILTAPGPVGQPFSIVHVDDLVKGIGLVLGALAEDRVTSGVYHLDGPASCCWEDYAGAFTQAFGHRVRLLRIPLPLLGLTSWGNAVLNFLGLPTAHLTPDKYREARQTGWLLDCAKARREVGYAPRIDLVTGAKDAIAWCRVKGLLEGNA